MATSSIPHRDRGVDHADGFDLVTVIDTDRLERVTGDPFDKLHDYENGHQMYFVAVDRELWLVREYDDQDLTPYLPIESFEHHELAVEAAAVIEDIVEMPAFVADTFNRFEEPWTVIVELQDGGWP